MKKLAFLFLAILYTLAPWAEAQTSKPKNVILILSDDHRYDFMGFMGRPKFLQTPAMDRMAAGGAHFRNAFVSTALCSPSRASILTGLYAHRHGVVDNQREIQPGIVFFPQLLQQAGYATAFVGKWHMGHDADDPRPGFDYWLSYRGQGVYFDPVFNINGERVERKGYTADIVTDYALDWMSRQTGPYFLLLSHKSVHAMFEPAPRHLGRYADEPLEYPRSMDPALATDPGRPSWVTRQRNSWHGVDFMYHGALKFDDFYRRYCETLLGLDESIGRVLDAVEARDGGRDTVVIYMGDNGFSFGEHGLIDKRHMYEESMRIPMLAWAPGYIRSGSVIEKMAQNIDLAPTVLELAGVTPPAGLDGASLVPLMEGREVRWRQEVLYEYYWEWNFPQTPTVLGLRTDRYKYIHYHGVWDTDELFDLVADPEEMRNLIREPGHRERVAAMRARLFELLGETDGRQIPLREPRGERMDRQQ